MRMRILAPLVVVAAMYSNGVAAQDIALFDWGFNIDGTTTLPGDALPAAIDATGFDFVTGLGDIAVSIDGTGNHAFSAFFDHEIDEATNTFFNESGATSGAAAAGQSWEIDEPGFFLGDIFDNFDLNTLDNTNEVPAGLEDDVSMAMGWDFVLADGETAVIDLTLSVDIPLDFFLSHTDANSDATIYFSSALNITGGPVDPPVGVPEPGTLLLMALGLVGIARAGSRRGRA